MGMDKIGEHGCICLYNAFSNNSISKNDYLGLSDDINMFSYETKHESCTMMPFVDIQIHKTSKDIIEDKQKDIDLEKAKDEFEKMLKRITSKKSYSSIHSRRYNDI